MQVNPSSPSVVQVTLQSVAIDRFKRHLQAELAEIKTQLPVNSADPLEQSLVAWQASFESSLNLPLDPREIAHDFVELLKGILRGPSVPGAPFPPELFGETPLPIVRFLVRKMRDFNSSLYCEAFNLEALQVEAEANIPPELLEQLRMIEEMNAKHLQEEARNMNRLHALEGRLKQQETALQQRIDQMARESLEAGQRLRADTGRLQQRDLEQRAIMRERAERQTREAEGLRAVNAELQRELVANRSQLGELDRAKIQLQANVNEVKAKAADKESDWLMQVGCLVASVAASWILKKVVVITPNGISIG